MQSVGPRLTYSDQLHAEKYRLKGETFRDAMGRVASALTSDDENASYHEFREILLDMRFMPAGRVQAAMGSPKAVTPYNCYVSGTIPDSFVSRDNAENSSIMHRAEQAATTMRMGGGIGYDFSTLRPDGAMIEKLQSRSSGPLGFMPIYNEVCKATSSAGNRRGAQMGVLRIDHPDSFKFIHVKHNQTALTGFNISLAITDEFMECLETGKPFALKFGGRVYQEVDAEEMWEALMRSTWDWAEPGVLFIDTINKMNNLWYCETIAATNPCVTGSTRLLTSQGYRRMADLAGREATWWNGRKFVTGPVFSTGQNPIVRVELSDGSSVECTPYHRFPTVDGMKEARELKPNDVMAKFDMPIVWEGQSYEDQGDGYSQGFFQGDGTSGSTKSWVYGPKYAVLSRLRGSYGKPHPERDFRVWSHGQMLPKDFVPTNASPDYCIDWLAGLLDADGTVQHGDVHDTVQLSSVDREFLITVRLMLTRLGVRAKVTRAKSSDGSYLPGSPYFRLLLCALDVQRLLELGLRTERLQIAPSNVARDKRRFVEVVQVIDLKRSEETFCVTDPEDGLATFDGVVTGNCGEQPLPPFGACLLGSFNLVRYLHKDLAGYNFDWDQLAADIPHVVRAMDNVVDRAIYPLKEQELEAKNKRRMGLGITAFANCVEAMGMPYGSKDCLSFENKLLAFITRHCYLSSTHLAEEKGAFPLYDSKYLQGKFIRTLDSDVIERIMRFGIRNSHLTSIAPTGTISMAADNVSSSIEPVYRYQQERTVLMDAGRQTIDLYDYGFANLHVRGKRTSMGEVSAKEHIAVLITAQKYIDSAVSKTVNCDGSMPWHEFKDIYFAAYKGGAKGATTFNKDGKRAGLFKETLEDRNIPFPVSTITASVGLADDVGLSCEFDQATGRRSCE